MSAHVHLGNLWRAFLQRRRRYVALVLWMAIIFYVSHQPASALPDYGVWDVFVKKSGHFLAYAVLALLAFRAAGRRPFARALALTTLYALSDEAHQLFVAGRNGRLGDVMIDVAGGLTALLLLHFVLWVGSPVVATGRKQPDLDRPE